jgi:hypothetical protein
VARRPEIIGRRPTKKAWSWLTFVRCTWRRGLPLPCKQDAKCSITYELIEEGGACPDVVDRYTQLKETEGAGRDSF